MLIYGINPVVEALRAGRVESIRISPRGDSRVNAVIDAAKRAGVGIKRVDAGELDRVSKGGVHQGVVAFVPDQARLSPEDLVTSAVGEPLIVVLDGVEDPHNVGAILRTVDAAGASGVVRQQRHAARLEGAAAKASAGAVSHV